MTQSVANLTSPAPVTQSAASGGFVGQFILPKGVTVASAPEPLDARIHFFELVPAQVAVIRYSGFWSESNYEQHLAKLKAAMRDADLMWTGEPVYARYDAPLMPWFCDATRSDCICRKTANTVFESRT